MQNNNNNTNDRELGISTTLDASIERVWEVWTNPNHIKNWWGPNGFTNSIHKMDVEPGGEWLLTMHGPDGKDYPNKSVFKEIVPRKKIVLQHFNPNFLAIIEFETQGEKTLLRWRSLFDSKEEFDVVVKTFKADEGMRQNVEKLVRYLSQQESMPETTVLKTTYRKDPAKKKIIVSRNFNAPVENVWKAWTDRKILDQWWAPKPWKTETATMDFSAGGSWFYAMVGPQGERHWCRNDYQAIIPLQHITGIDYFCDEKGLKDSTLPVQRWQITFEPLKNSTNVVVEITFEREADLLQIVEMGFEQGFAMAHTNLDELLVK